MVGSKRFEARKIVSESEGSESEVRSVGQMKTSTAKVVNLTTRLSDDDADSNAIPLPTDRAIPRRTFPSTPKIPLTPCKMTFTPSGIKKVEFGATKLKIPGKKLEGLKLVSSSSRGAGEALVLTPARISTPAEGERPEDDLSGGEQEREVEDVASELDLGALKLDDEPSWTRSEDIGATQFTEVVCHDEGIHEVDEEEVDDVDGLLRFSPEPASVSLHATSPPRSPIPTKPLITAPVVSPIFVPSDSSDSESDCPIFARTPHRTPAATRRRIVISDSESDSGSESPGIRDPTSPIPARRGTQADQRPEPRAGPSVRKSKPAALRFIEDHAYDHDDEKDFEEEEDEDSMGSLRDFIVDDDYSSECSASEESEDEDEIESDGIELLDTPPRSKRDDAQGKRGRITLDDEDDRDSDEEDRCSEGHHPDDMLHHSSPRMVHRLDLPDLESLTIISSDSESDSEGECSSSGSDGHTRRGVKTKPDSTPKTRSDPRTKSTTETNSKTKTGGREKAQLTAKSFTAKAWGEERTRIAQSIFTDLDERVFEGRLAGAGARLVWNKRLLTTAGLARSKRVTKNGQSKKGFWIELSEKVLTGESQILNTVAHEMCHLATWIISNDYKNPHGSVFKSWGRKVMRAKKGIEVTTTHSYVIEYKYEWKCSNERCRKIYKRHSKSIDIAKHRCGSCKSVLVPLFESKQKTASAFQLYLKANMKFAKAAMPSSSHGEVMRALSKRWNELGEGQGEKDGAQRQQQHETYWRGMGGL